MKINPLLKIFNDWYGKLKSNERRFLLVLVLVLGVSFYFTLVLKPALNDIYRLKKQEQENQNQLGMLKSQFPSVLKTKQEIETIKQNLKDLKSKISNIESQLIGSSQEQQLLTEAIKNAQSLGIDLESVKEDIKEEKEGFIRVYIELKLVANYRKVANYIKRIELISPFVKIEEMILTQSKNEPLSMVEATLTISSLLSNESKNQSPLSLAVKEPPAEIGELKRSPFTPRFVTEKTKRKNLKVTGITYRNNEAGSTAIVNGVIVRIGDQLEGVKIESILFNSVVIDNGVEKEILKLER